LSLSARNHIINKLTENLSFSFKEEDLSPQLRKQIGNLASKVDKEWSLHDLMNAHKKNAILSIMITGLSGFCGLLFIFLVSEWFGWGASVIGIVFLLVALYFYIEKRTQTQKSNDFKSEEESLRTIIDEETLLLAKSAYNELTIIHDARIRPTIKQINIDFASIIQNAKGKGIILEKVECPYCNSSIKIPKTGEQFSCEYCGRMIHATNLFDKLKDIINLR